MQFLNSKKTNYPNDDIIVKFSVLHRKKQNHDTKLNHLILRVIYFAKKQNEKNLKTLNYLL